MLDLGGWVDWLTLDRKKMNKSFSVIHQLPSLVLTEILIKYCLITNRCQGLSSAAEVSVTIMLPADSGS